jgi:hypothetical protein
LPTAIHNLFEKPQQIKAVCTSYIRHPIGFCILSPILAVSNRSYFPERGGFGPNKGYKPLLSGIPGYPPSQKPGITRAALLEKAIPSFADLRSGPFEASPCSSSKFIICAQKKTRASARTFDRFY